MQFSLYKPNAKTTGCCASFNYDAERGSVFVTLIRQASWDDEKKIGSFKANIKNPTNIKFNQSEIGGIMYAIENKTNFSTYHKSNAGDTQISFYPYLKEDVLKGFILATTKKSGENEVKLSIGLNLGEAMVLLNFLVLSLTQTFNVQKVKKEEPEPTPKKPTPTEQDEEDIF